MWRPRCRVAAALSPGGTGCSGGVYQTVKISEVRQMSTEELHGELDVQRRRLFDLRAQAVTEKLANPNLVTQAKRDIARIFTVLRERGEAAVEERLHHLEAMAVQRGKSPAR